MAGKDARLTDMNQASGWYAILPPPALANRLKGDQIADWVVVGAGVTGLAAARRLAELAPDARIVLLEEYRVGYGASGRNSGFIIDTPHLSEDLDADANRRISRLVVAGLAELEGNVRKYNINCEWSASGHLTAAVGHRRLQSLKATVWMLAASNEEHQWFEGDALADVIGTHHYRAAVVTPRTVLMNPAAMCRGLGETLPESVEVFEETPVHQVVSGAPVKIECAEGTLNTKNVLLTTNAFITRLNYLKRDVFPLIECASLSRPLNDEELALMTGEPEWGITGYATLRRTLSNRILVRHGTFYSMDFCINGPMRNRLQAAQLKGLVKRYPMLKNLEFEHTWAGVFCMTRNMASCFGRLDRGVFAALGYCGVGVPRGTISGKLLAEYALGSESELINDVVSVSRPTTLPPKPFLGLGVRSRLAWHRWRNRAEW